MAPGDVVGRHLGNGFVIRVEGNDATYLYAPERYTVSLSAAR